MVETLLEIYVKDPDSIVDYRFDWSDDLDDDEILTASRFFVTAPDYEDEFEDKTLELIQESNGDTYGVAQVGYGVFPSVYLLTQRVSTSHGRVNIDWTIKIRIKQK